jgi:hypothetical protein
VLTDREYHRREYHRDNEEPTDSMTSEPSSFSHSSEQWSDENRAARTGTKDKKALLQFDIYITQKDSSSSSSTSSLPHPRSRSGVVDVHYHWGRRPDVSTLFSATADHVKQLHHNAFVSGYTTSHVAVIACGPAQLVSAAKRAARSQSDAAVVFDFHEEVFEY